VPAESRFATALRIVFRRSREFGTLSPVSTQLETPIPDRIVREPRPAPELGSVVVVETPAKRASFLSRNRTLVWFVGLLVLLDVVVGRFAGTWQKHSPDDYALRVEACARERRDIVFLGGSPVAEGIDPARFAGRGSMYSMGLSGGTTSDFYHAVLRGCPEPPKMLVYGITATDINDSRNEPHGPYSLMTAGDVVRWVKLRPDSAEWVIRHSVQARFGKVSNLFRYRHAIRMWAATEANELHPGASPETMAEADELREHAELLLHGNGYAPARGHSAMRLDGLKEIGRAPTSLPYLAKYRTGSHLKYLHALVDWCESNGVKLVLVDMPVSADLERIHAAEFAEYRTRLEEVERSRGLTVIRAPRDAVGLGDRHFSDLIHLNKDGAARLSEWLATRPEINP
jgi:hypothetical protein